MLEIIHFLLTILILIAVLNIFLSNNPVFSVLYLILSFCLASVICILFGAEFIGLIFITVYVGAVAVLFLFVVMMINIKKNLSHNVERTTNFFSYFGPLIFYKIHQIIFSIFSDNHIADLVENKNDYFHLLLQEPLSNTEIIGQVLFNVYGHAILIAGFILLIALVGSIALTINFKDSELLDKEYAQLSRSKTTIIKTSNKQE